MPVLRDIEDKGVGGWESSSKGQGAEGSVPGWKSEGRDRRRPLKGMAGDKRSHSHRTRSPIEAGQWGRGKKGSEQALHKVSRRVRCWSQKEGSQVRNWFVGREGGGGRSDIDGINHRGSTGEDRDLQHPEPPAPALSFQDGARVAGYGKVLGKERGARQQGLGIF